MLAIIIKNITQKIKFLLYLNIFLFHLFIINQNNFQLFQQLFFLF